MRPDIPAVLRTLKASLEEHVIPELDSHYALGQAGQIALTLQWLADGWVEPLQTLRTGNAAIRDSLTTVSETLAQLQAHAGADSGHWQLIADQLTALLGAAVEDTGEAQQADREDLTSMLDDLVIAAGPPGMAETRPLWQALHNSLGKLRDAETVYGPIPLPEEHWER